MRLFVDNKREPNQIYRNGEWVHVETLSSFKETLNLSIGNRELPKIISFDYDLENKKEGLKAVDYLVNSIINSRLPIPKVYLHCDDRALAIDFENSLNLYTKRTGNSYFFEYVKRF